MTAVEWLEQISWVLLVALLGLLGYILVKRMAWAMRKHETQGMFTEFTRDRDEWVGRTLVVRFRVPSGARSMGLRCEWKDPRGENTVLWEREVGAGEHEIQLDTSTWPSGRNSYRLVTEHQVLERFVNVR